MSEPTTPIAPQARSPRLAIVHFLGWTLGVAAVLAILREITDLSQYPEDLHFSIRLQQLGFGLAYGTAISGLGLFLWRWRRGLGAGPTQPGHWLLVFGGIGLVIDLGASGIVALFARGLPLPDFRLWLAHRAIAWGAGSLVAAVVLVRLRGASRLWTCVTLAVTLMLITNTLVSIASLVGMLQGALGMWIWRLPSMVQFVLTVGVLLLMWAAELSDRVRKLPRDWLHSGGILAMSGLGLVSLAGIVRALS